MASISEITIKQERRRAIYRSKIDRPNLGITKGAEVECRVFGCYQVADGDDVNPYFVVELKNGRCTHVNPDDLQFIKEEDEAEC